MADSYTTNFGWTKPDVGASDDSWGGKLNTDLDNIDTAVFARLVDANADGNTYGRKNGAWSQVAASVVVADTAPATPKNGDLWFDSTGTQLYCYYNDGSSSQWVIVVNTGNAGVNVGTSPPANPQQGTLWYDSNGGQLYCWYNDGTSAQWVIAVNSGSGAGYLPLQGVTDGSNAPAGQIGEFLQAVQAAPISLTSNNNTTVVVLNLTAGDWDVWTHSNYAASPGAQILYSAISPGGSANAGGITQLQLANIVNWQVDTAPIRASLTTTTSFSLMSIAVFSSGTCTVAGSISARRRR